MDSPAFVADFDSSAAFVRALAAKQLRRWMPTMVVEPPTLAIGLTKSYLHCGIRTPIKAFLAGLHDPIESRMPQIEVPTLIVRGERDRIVSAEWAATLTRLLPHGELATIGGFAHTLDYAAPQQLAEVTFPFMHGVRPRTSRGKSPS
ncbi:MAG: alpha/beta fold hydrolase [Acidothermaceae bacterium]